MNNGSRGPAAQTETMAQSLEACAHIKMECGKCHKTFGLGCARELKLEAAALLYSLSRSQKEGDKRG